MRLECLEYVDFRDIVFDFLYNPVPKHVYIFLKKEEACKILANAVTDLAKAIGEEILTPYISQSEQRIRLQSKEGSLIEIWTRENLGFCCCGNRGSIVIGDAGYSIEDTYEVLLPMANIDVQRYYFVSSDNIMRYWKDKLEKGLEDIDYWINVKNDKVQLQFKPIKGEENGRQTD